MKRQDQGLWIALGVLFVVLLAIPMVGGGMMASGMMGRGMMGWYGVTGEVSSWMWPIGWLAMVLFWASIIALVVLGFRRLTSSSDNASPEPPESPTEILKHRFAVGDISREQFEEMTRVMQGPA